MEWLIVILLILLHLWEEENLKVINENIKKLGQEIELLKSAKNTEQQVQPDNADETVIATFYVRDDGKQ